MPGSPNKVRDRGYESQILRDVLRDVTRPVVGPVPDEPAAGAGLLLEGSGFLLLENGDFLLLE